MRFFENSLGYHAPNRVSGIPGQDQDWDYYYVNIVHRIPQGCYENGPVMEFYAIFLSLNGIHKKWTFPVNKHCKHKCSLKTQIQMFENFLVPFNPNDFHHFFFLDLIL